jgi:hypothetical protein
VPERNQNGTYGRLRYAASVNAFVLVSSRELSPSCVLPLRLLAAHGGMFGSQRSKCGAQLQLDRFALHQRAGDEDLIWQLAL